MLVWGPALFFPVMIFPLFPRQFSTAQADLRLMEILLLQPPKFWYYRQRVPSHSSLGSFRMGVWKWSGKNWASCHVVRLASNLRVTVNLLYPFFECWDYMHASVLYRAENKSQGFVQARQVISQLKLFPPWSLWQAGSSVKPWSPQRRQSKAMTDLAVSEA